MSAGHSDSKFIDTIWVLVTSMGVATTMFFGDYWVAASLAIFAVMMLGLRIFDAIERKQ